DEVEWPKDEDQAAVRTRLLESGVVGTATAPANLPLVLDDAGRLYLHRYFDYERRLARRLMQLATSSVHDIADVGALRERLNALFAGNETRLGGRVDWQKVATVLAMLRKLTIISGGPGTGKTTTVVNLLACLLAQDPDCRIKLAAPTGKAATRMRDAMRVRSQHLPSKIAARLPDDAFTIHRLLGVTPGSHEFRHHIGNRLPIDVLVVDEASMLDLALATRLLEAVPDSARVILLGDKDQLAAVEAGAVFSEICADPSMSDEMRERVAALAAIAAKLVVPASATETTPLRDSVVWFSDNYRFASDSGIGRLAALVNAGDSVKAMTWLRESCDASVTWLEDGGRAPQAATIACARKAYRAYLDAVQSRAAVAAIFAEFGRFRVLCAERDGARGVSGMNEALSRWYRATLDHPLDPGSRSPWYPGRPVIALRNDYLLKLFNGDVGIVLPDDAGNLMAYFPEADDSFRAIPPARLPDHDTAFATTVHKAQGSEFDEVLLMLPAKASRVVTRELIYTGVTRARTRVILASEAEVLAQGVASRTSRHSGLIDRMRDLVPMAGD
ncbi:MAG TPA: exodeoxyribonuclease V subunit alpha, partial [Casimicrobiaceae bacterium]|nr:exodeoxyribonuclease V subunit alpha [Casimicrobiaceae bacterium]